MIFSSKTFNSRLELELERDKRERDERERQLRERELREMELREKMKHEMDLKPPGICQDMKRPGICQDYSGLWCYDIIWSDQVYVGITQGCDVMILYEATRYMSGLLRAVMLCDVIYRSDQVYVRITQGCDVMILYEAARYMSGLLRAVMLWYYMKRPGICRDYSGRWCYDIIWSDQVYVGITGGDVMILYEATRYMGLLRAVMLWYYMKRPGICRDYSGRWCYDIIWSDSLRAVYMSGLLWCYDIIWSGQVYVGITPGCDVMILYYKKLWCYDIIWRTRYMSGLLRILYWPGICQDYSGLWCYDIIWSDQVYVRITPGGDVMILYEATQVYVRYMSGLLRAVMLWYYIWSDQVYVGITPGCDVMIL